MGKVKHMAPIKVLEVGIKKKKGFLYFLDKEGDISSVPMMLGNKKGEPQKIAKVGLRREAGHLYFIDKQGDISAAVMKGNHDEEKMNNEELLRLFHMRTNPDQSLDDLALKFKETPAAIRRKLRKLLGMSYIDYESKYMTHNKILNQAGSKAEAQGEGEVALEDAYWAQKAINAEKTGYIGEKPQQVSKSYSIEAIRKVHSKAYTSWSTKEDDDLKREYLKGVSTKELSEIFQRQESAIYARLRKLLIQETFQG